MAPLTPASGHAETAARYVAALETLTARGRFGIRLGLGRTRALLRILGDPQQGLRGALIGGTNGKGSVQALVAAVLATTGLRIGQTPKPHLVSYRERLVVDGRPIARHEFADLIGEVLPAAEKVARRLGPPTEFELLTAAAFLWFARSGVEVAVLEVGLGGRLDAMNAWDGGVAAITNVAWDHMDRLGHTLVAIGREKAAIIKRGDLAVTGACGSGLDVIRRRARRLGVPLNEVQPLPVLAMDRAGLTLAHPEAGELRLGLLGRHQAENAAVAVGVVEALAAAGIARTSLEQLRSGLAAARWPGRLELLRLMPDGRAAPSDGRPADPRTPDLVLDGAHNAAGTVALAAALEELRPSLSPGRATLLLGLMADKDVAGLLAPLTAAAALRGARIIATTAPGGRALPADELAEAWRRVTATVSPGTSAGGVEVQIVASLDEALERGTGAAREEEGPLIVAGSLYLVGAVRGALVHDTTLHDPLPSSG